MASKSRANGLNSVHAAGIFADMTVDGPDIGTLVVIVDRAKNLPNRKTIGKQDPYCAARLGKEAKKTETDRRGGQTPRWDQELRFTVHDSPDYYQLKVSVFNDDKKTEIIGEAWVDLKEVVVSGGGQNDLWHNLTYKGKYAGEIRIEITYYDTRPKEEKPQKIRQAGLKGVQDGSRETLSGPRQPKAHAPTKRRPLPSDPITGAPSTPPSAIPDHIQTPPRGYQKAPSPPTALPDHVQTPPRGYQSPSYVQDQSPLQRVEYSTPPHRFSQSQGYAQSPGRQNGYAPSPREQQHGYGNSNEMIVATPPAQQAPNDRYDSVDPGNDYSSGNGGSYEEEHFDLRDHYIPQQLTYDLPPPDEYGSLPSPGGPPPPPPAHGSKHASPAPPMSSHASYGFPSNTPTRPMIAYDPSPSDIHRQSMQPYSQPKVYEAYSPPEDEQFSPRSGNNYQQIAPRHRSYDSANNAHDPSPPRHHSYDSNYNNQPITSMQPTVEDAPPTPSPAQYMVVHRGSSSHTPQYEAPRYGTPNYEIPQYDEQRYDQVPSPAPLNLSGRGSSASGRNSAQSSIPTHQPSNSSNGYASTTASDLSYRDQSSVSSFRDQSVASSRTSYNSLPNYAPQRRRSEDQMTGSPIGYGMPSVPTSLVAGMDPDIAKEISDRIYNEKRASQSAGNSPRGRPQQALQYQPAQNRPHPLSYHEAAPVPFVPASASFDDQQSRFSTGTAPMIKPRAISPNPRGSTIRKSVSPSPGAPEARRLSGIPFGPDSYNALNPALSGSTSAKSLSEKYDPKEVDPDAKIITHDGREIDPSDHIPESNYAPLRETAQPKYASQLPDRNYRPPGGQPLPASGRRPLKVAQARPHSTTISGPIFSGGFPDSTPPPSGRNRLQKKSNRMSAQPPPQSGALEPVSLYHGNAFTPRSLPRANTGDFLGENYAPPNNYGAIPSYKALGYRGTSGGAPPVPAKVPVSYGGYNQGQLIQSGDGDPWSLLDEMKNIDLGSGRARRRNY